MPKLFVTTGPLEPRPLIVGVRVSTREREALRALARKRKLSVGDLLRTALAQLVEGSR